MDKSGSQKLLESARSENSRRVVTFVALVHGFNTCQLSLSYKLSTNTGSNGFTFIMSLHSSLGCFVMRSDKKVAKQIGVRLDMALILALSGRISTRDGRAILVYIGDIDLRIPRRNFSLDKPIVNCHLLLPKSTPLQFGLWKRSV